MVKTIELRFEGYFMTKDLPLKQYPYSGIYLVYKGEVINLDTCKLMELLYIGESENVATRLGKHHESYDEWRLHLNKGEWLFYYFAKVPDADRERAEAALIFHYKPPCNIQNIESFDYPETKIIVTGINAYIDTDFIEPFGPENDED